MILAHHFINLLNKACHHYLALDPLSKKRLATLNDKTVTIQLKAIPLTLQCHITDEHIEIISDETYTPDAVITGTPLQLLGVTFNKSQRQSFFADDVTIHGDTLIAQQFIQLFDELEIDWEEKTAALLGDIPTHHLSQLIKKGKRWLNENSDHFIQNVSDYLQEEKNWLPTREALQDFYCDVDELKLEVDRLIAKAAILTQKIN